MSTAAEPDESGRGERNLLDRQLVVLLEQPAKPANREGRAPLRVPLGDQRGQRKALLAKPLLRTADIPATRLVRWWGRR